MRPFSIVATVLALCAASVHAQTTTVIDQLGQTVVEVITVDPNLGVPVTETLQTLTTSSTTTPNNGQAGPVGQPQTQQAAGPTIYTYTTTDANGNTEAVVDTFTPTYDGPTTGGSITAAPGTVLDFSSWRASVGTNTVAVLKSGASRWTVQTRWVGFGAAICAGITGGAWLALA